MTQIPANKIDYEKINLRHLRSLCGFDTRSYYQLSFELMLRITYFPLKKCSHTAFIPLKKCN